MSDDIIQMEEKKADLNKRPFKIAYLDEDWIMGEITQPENIKQTIKTVLANPRKFKKERQYWGEQSCYKCDGKSSLRIIKMIEHFQQTGERRQIGDLD